MHSLSKINKNSKIKFYLNISNIKNSHPLLDNSICMIFTKSENKNKYPSLNINTLNKVPYNYFAKLKENLANKPLTILTIRINPKLLIK